MSLLKLASLHSIENFWRSTDATNSLVVVLPFEPPTAITGSEKSRRYAAASFPNAVRVSATASTAQPGSFAGHFFPSTTTAATPSFATAATKLWPSKFSPLMAKNTSPGFASFEFVQTFFIFVSAAPDLISASQAPATNFKERSSTKLFQQKRRGHHRRDGFLARRRVVQAFAAGFGAVLRRDLENALVGVVQPRDAATALRGDLVGAGAGVLRGLGEHLDFRDRKSVGWGK